MENYGYVKEGRNLSGKFKDGGVLSSNP